MITVINQFLMVKEPSDDFDAFFPRKVDLLLQFLRPEGFFGKQFLYFIDYQIELILTQLKFVSLLAGVTQLPSIS